MAKDKEDQSEKSYVVRFDCWACRKSAEIDIFAVQDERTRVDYSAIHPDPNDPQQYYLKCPDCDKFNAVVL